VAYDPPKIDRRAAAEIEAALVSELAGLRGLNPAWKEFDPGSGLSGAMIGIFGRLAEIVIRRLNGVPEKNFLAFLDLLGASPLPPQPARVPLTFTLAAGSTADAVVPAGTQVAAPPAEGEKEPVIYETERELVVTAAQLDSVFVREPEQDRYADRSALVNAPEPGGAPVFAGERRTEHIFYVGHAALFGLPSLRGVRLRFNLTASVQPEGRVLKWEIWDGVNGVPLNPSSDTTAGLTRTGEVTFGKLMAGGALTGPDNAALTANSPFPLVDVGGIPSRWLRCRLVTPIIPSQNAVGTMVRESQLPTIASVNVSVELDSDLRGLAPDAASANNLPLDTTKDFLPFGAAPKYGDTFYVADREALSKTGATITLKVQASDPAAAGIKPPAGSPDLRLRWEYWDGAKWVELATTDRGGATTAQRFTDTTKALTVTGAVTFVLPADAAPTTVNGVENAWVRVRIVSGNYGAPARYEPVNKTDLSKGYQLIDATLAPPSLSSVTLDYALLTAESPPDTVVTYNDFAYAKAATPFKPFQAVADDEPTLYLGFSLPPSRTAFPNRKLSLFVGALDLKHGQKYGPLWPRRSTEAGDAGSVVKHRFWLTNGTTRPALFVPDVYGSAWVTDKPSVVEVAPGASSALDISANVPAGAPSGRVDRGFIRLTRADEPGVEHGAVFETYAGEEPDADAPQLAWEYWDGGGWETLVVRDDSRGLTAPGLVEFLAPGDFALHADFGRERFWLRARWKSGAYAFAPQLDRLLLNTAMASQTVTVRDEVLGSSDASKGQKFRATRAPVLPGEWLEVREPELPSALDVAANRDEVGDAAGDLVRVVKDEAGQVKEIWVRWRGVPDFYSSGPRDRHYVLDRLTGAVSFGDGLNGMIPPAGAGNLRMRRYQTGGGAVGNRPAGVVAQLKTTVPYIDKVINFLPATGGADAEDTASLVERAPRTLRHGGRAVTIEDYEDLSKLASPEVARVKCVPLYDLATDPDATEQRLGFVSVIVVPRADEPRPVPSVELLGRVRDFLDRRRAPNADISVVGPDYMRVDIEAALGVGSLEGAAEVEAAVTRTLSRFLHPLTGGLDGKGWDFGRKPHKSDLYALLEGTPGVDHVISLRVTESKERADATTTERFLVYSGAHRISLTLGAR
jgi:hypothetical protein